MTPPSPFEAPLERLGLGEDADEDEQEEEEVRAFKMSPAKRFPRLSELRDRPIRIFFVSADKDICRFR